MATYASELITAGRCTLNITQFTPAVHKIKIDHKNNTEKPRIKTQLIKNLV